MGYLVLARKYRPQSFADLTGQEHVVQTLSNALIGGRVAHAHLFCGPRGCGKTTTARIVARALNCEKGPTPNPCGVCRPCIEIAAGTDMDVQEIDAASNTGVDNVRELRESAKYLPAKDRFKIFIVDEVHMLSKAAFNAFLKTLEEPPGHVKFLFATTDPQALPETILSRCQRHNFRLVPLKLIVDRIRTIAAAESVTIDDGAMALVARQAAGSMRDALSLLDQIFSACPPGTPISAADAAQALGALDRAVVARVAAALLSRDAAGVLAGVAETYDGGHDLKRFAEDLATHLRNLIAARVAGAPLDLPDHEIKALRDQSSAAEPAEVVRLFDLVHGALFEISRSMQPRHALEIALLRAVYLAPSVSVQTLIARADEIARRLAGEQPQPPSGGRAPAPQQARPSYEGSGPSRPSFMAQPKRDPQASAAAPAIAAVAVPAPAPAPVIAAPNEKPKSPWARHLSVVPDEDPVEKSVEADGPPALGQISPAGEPPASTNFVQRPQNERAIQAVPRILPPPADAEFAHRWPALVEGVRVRRRAAAAFLQHAHPVSLGQGELALAFRAGDLSAQRVNADRADLEAIFSEILNEPTRMKIVELSADDTAAIASLAASIAESEDRVALLAREARMKAGREDPAVLRAVALLGAEIEDVRDLGGGTP